MLTGSNGFLGRYFFDELTKDHDVDTISRSNSTFQIDLSKVVPDFKFRYDLVIHNAGLAHVSVNEINKYDFNRINVIGTSNLLKGLEMKTIPNKLIFISSVSVYGKDFGSGIDENTPLLAKDPYGLSKIQAEQILLDWCEKYNVICTILRLPLLVGQDPPGNLGAMIKGIQKGYYFNIAGGNAKKSMVLADDVAKSILKVAEIGGIYNFTDGYHPSFDELSNHISIQLGKGKPMNFPLWLAIVVARVGDLLGNKAPLNTIKLNKINSDLTFDDRKARKAFGWNPRPVLEGFKLTSRNL